MNKLLKIAVILFLVVFTITGCGNYFEQSLPSSDLSSNNVTPTPEPTVPLEPTTEPTPTFDASQINIGLYSGKGSWDLNVSAFTKFFNQQGYSWEEFDEMDLTVDDFLTDYDLIWFPGGFSSEYKNYISALGHENIIKYVNEGGNIAGSCAGAYFLSRTMVWDGSSSEYPIKAFNGQAIWPVGGPFGWGDVAQFSINEEIYGENFSLSIPIYYFDGPYFISENEDDVTVLARYEINGKPAIISGEYGEGKYILFGPHPELGNYDKITGELIINGGQGSQWEWLQESLKWFFDFR